MITLRVKASRDALTRNNHFYLLVSEVMQIGTSDFVNETDTSRSLSHEFKASYVGIIVCLLVMTDFNDVNI